MPEHWLCCKTDRELISPSCTTGFFKLTIYILRICIFLKCVLFKSDQALTVLQNWQGANITRLHNWIFQTQIFQNTFLKSVFSTIYFKNLYVSQMCAFQKWPSVRYYLELMSPCTMFFWNLYFQNASSEFVLQIYLIVTSTKECFLKSFENGRSAILWSITCIELSQTNSKPILPT